MWVLSPGQVRIWKFVFLGGLGKPENMENNPQSKRAPTTNSTHIRHQGRIEPKPHWLEASSLSTAPSLLSQINIQSIPRILVFN